MNHYNKESVRNVFMHSALPNSLVHDVFDQLQHFFIRPELV